MKKIFAVVLSLCFAVLFICGCEPKKNEEEKPQEQQTIELLEFGNVKTAKNIILLIGDGMGPEEVKFGNLNSGDSLYMEKIPNRVFVETRSLDSTITDSAAAGTALATGVRTNNGWVGLTPDEDILETIVDIAAKQGKRTGVVTTEDLSGATPMCFSGHSTSRADSVWLYESAARSSRVNLFVSTGGIENYENIVRAGYKQIENVDDISESTEDKIIGAYPIDATAEKMSDYSFDRIVKESIEYLSKDEDGFFLMAEGAHIDHGGHANDIMWMLRELNAFDEGVKYAVEWARERDDTVVLVTADHETGGLQLGSDIDSENLFDTDDYGNFLNFEWTTMTHTGVDVYLYVYGMEMDYLKFSSFNDKTRIKNTDVFDIMKYFFYI